MTLRTEIAKLTCFRNFELYFYVRHSCSVRFRNTSLCLKDLTFMKHSLALWMLVIPVTLNLNLNTNLVTVLQFDRKFIHLLLRRTTDIKRNASSFISGKNFSSCVNFVLEDSHFLFCFDLAPGLPTNGDEMSTAASKSFLFHFPICALGRPSVRTKYKDRVMV